MQAAKFVLLFTLLISKVNLYSQTNATIYLKDGSNFYISKAFDIANDSISIQMEKQECMRIPISFIKKIYLFENPTRVVDSINTIILKNETHIAATNAFKFTKASVNLTLTDGTHTTLPLNQIDYFLIHTDSIYIKNNLGKRLSYGIMNSFSFLDKEVMCMQPEFVVSYNLKNQISLQVNFGHIIINNTEAFQSKYNLLGNYKFAKTKNQTDLGKSINLENFQSRTTQGSINQNFYCIGFKAHYYLFGTKVENYAGLGFNYYLGSKNLSIGVESDWIKIDRRVNLIDTLSGKKIAYTEPMLGKVTMVSNFNRKAFTSVDASYRIKYKFVSKLFIINEIGVLFGKLIYSKVNKTQNEYQYLGTNIYADETSIYKEYTSETQINFSQLYLKIGILF